MVIIIFMKNKKMPIWGKILLIIMLVILFIISGGIGYTYYQISKVSTTKISKSNEDLGIKPEVLKQIEEQKIEGKKIEENKIKDNKIKEKKVESGTEIINIAFFGVDRRYKNEPSRSDSIMVLTVDEKHKKIKMSSIMRDTYVHIKDHGMTKINHAYAYGGPELAIRTLNDNFNLDIKNFVTVDFFNLESIIDSLGGVSINVRADEIKLINSYMEEIGLLERQSFKAVIITGVQNLNGKQAVAYSRIRYTAGGDFVRSERQRTVLSALLKKIQSAGKLQFPTIAAKLLQYTETSMSSIDIIKLGTAIFTNDIRNLDQERFPVDGYCKGEMIGGVWYLVSDIKATKLHIYKYIYEDEKPISKMPLF